MNATEEKTVQINRTPPKCLAAKIFRTTLTMLVSFIILSVLGIIIVFYSPLTYFKELYVTTAMTTMTHQYLARIFVSEEEIQRIMEKNKLKEPGENTNAGEVSAEAQSNNIQLVNINTVAYRGYLLIVSNPEKVTIGSTSHLGKKGMTVKDIVKEYGAIGGINAGGFADPGGHGKGGQPDGILIEDFNILHNDNSRKHRIIGLDRNNVLILGTYTKEEIINLGIRDAVSFRPFIIVNGKPTITRGNGGWGIAPRTAIGQKKDGTILMLAIDGRQVGSIGASLKDVQDIMLQYGAYNAANLDGGSSTTLVYQDSVINKPSSKYGPRNVPSAFIIMP